MREKRLKEIEDYIRKNGSVSLDDLCREFDVSKNTIRRDVAEIVERSDIRKIYGGVSAQRNVIPPPFAERSAVNQDIKESLGRKAAQFVNDGDIIYVDSGTTTCRMIDHLGERNNVTVVTHSLDVINRAVALPGLNIIALSGTLNRKTLSFTGQSTIDVL
ncbi:MAG: DeoR/GlpR transcriptional regulator [Oscillospiraceae bacterium]|nr:DeoR/GlpR transcriptional regulator [Oscillospiraceae bacterium]